MKKNKFNIVSNYKGTLNKTEFLDFINICKLTQEELYMALENKLKECGYEDLISNDGYIYAKGDIPILLTAHLDTVHKETVKDFYEYVDENGNHIISSPQGIGGDDRCGVYMILEIIKEYKPYILFCKDEEIGGVGSGKFCKTEYINDLSKLNYLIELDRANGNDAVFYECDNPDFTKFILNTTDYKENIGSFSDISNLSPCCGVASVNLSCGYYHAHTVSEEVNIEEMLNTIDVVKKLLTTESEQFEYIENDFMYDDWFGYEYYGRRNRYDETLYLYITYVNKKGLEDMEAIECSNIEEGFGKFFMDNRELCFNDVIDYEYEIF